MVQKVLARVLKTGQTKIPLYRWATGPARLGLRTEGACRVPGQAQKERPGRGTCIGGVLPERRCVDVKSFTDFGVDSD